MEVDDIGHRQFCGSSAVCEFTLPVAVAEQLAVGAHEVEVG